ncbi:PspC domain-containing protein [Massilibacterium senegalense]|uniref:PspC domain-containing protein n=1 Tax=Massilibacterium senegalense TaxID=1632858 RepID=UPI000780803C|nr:PspC domain-containing protein [Massilibacterium senegalense]
MKKLYRSEENRMLAGICGGLGDYLNIDPTILRIALVALMFATGFLPILLAYVLGVAIVPTKSEIK